MLEAVFKSWPAFRGLIFLKPFLFIPKSIQWCCEIQGRSGKRRGRVDYGYLTFASRLHLARKDGGGSPQEHP